MAELLQPLAAFASATVVALIGLFFAAMFLFFSGAAAMVLGQFLPFASKPRVALPTIAMSCVAVALITWLAGAPLWYASVPITLVSGLLWFGVLQMPSIHRLLRYGAAALLVAAIAMSWLREMIPALDFGAVILVQAFALLISTVVVGLLPLVLAGLVQHRRERPVEWFISLRYLVAKRRQTFISVITVICVVGVSLGVAVITVVLSVMNGFSGVWEDKIIGARAHFVVHARTGEIENYLEVREKIVAMPEIEGATPYMDADAILRSGNGEIQAIVLKGIHPETVGDATQLPNDIVAGSLADLDPDPQGEGDAKLAGAVIGAEIADRFLLQVGDTIVLISPLGGRPTPMGPAPRLERFRVAGVFRSNFFQFDESFVYTSLAGVQKFLKTNDVVSGIEVRSVDPYRSQAIGERVVYALGGLFFARDWKTFYPAFFQALQMERAMMFVLLSFIMVVAGFIIIATLIMMIMEKSRDIAILKTMGCEDDGVLRVFAIGGVLIGTSGLALGLGMGLVITWNLSRIQSVVETLLGHDILPANVYQLQTFPYEIVPWQLVLISVIALTLSIGATLLPAWQAARLDPAEALRYE